MRKVLLSTPRLTALVCTYGPGERHARHADAHSRISLLVRGAYREDADRGSITMRPGEVLMKSHRALHEDAFGDAGATLVALEFLEQDPFEMAGVKDLWRRRADGFALRHATTFLEAAIAGDEVAANAAGEDLVADCGREPSRRSTAPAWLALLKDALDTYGLAEIDVATHAREAGVHPSHLSRLFRRCYGLSVTEYAQAQSVRRALTLLGERGANLSEAALAAGFYDQSHMNRVFRRVTGRSPGAQRALLAAVC
jgi:AraC family transcriptional regulator